MREVKANMTYHYRTGPRDFWAATVILLIRTPLLRYSALCIMGALFVGFCTSYLLRNGTTVAGAVTRAALIIAGAISICWLVGRAIVSRLQESATDSKTQTVTVSASGLEIQSHGCKAVLHWEAVSEMVVTRNYIHLLTTGLSAYALRRAGFDSPDMASKFFAEAAAFLPPNRLIILGNPKKLSNN